MLRSLSSLFLLAITIVGPGALFGSQLPPQVEEALRRGEAALSEGQMRAARREFEKAAEQMDGPEFRCSLGLAASYSGTGAPHDGRIFALRAIQLAKTPEQRARAYTELGHSELLIARSQPAALETAVTSLRQALLECSEASPELVPRVSFWLGEALLRLGERQEGRALLEAAVAAEPVGREAGRAARWLADPSTLLSVKLPAFSARALDGSSITHGDLVGRVTLLDFWGAWCGPCRAAIPELKELSAKWPSEAFRLISISSDRDLQTAEDFIAEHEMNWTQVWEEEQGMIRAFRVRQYPTYVIVGPQGEILARYEGRSARLSATVTAAVEEARTSRENDD